MKTTLDLLNDVIDLGFTRDEALKGIDRSLDYKFGYENRKSLEEEILTDNLYGDILYGFKCEMEARIDYEDKREKERKILERKWKESFKNFSINIPEDFEN